MLPQNLNFKGKIESAPAISQTTCLQPQNGTGPYSNSNTIIFNIPTQNNTVLSTTESYLKFSFKITNGATANCFRWDSSSHGIIQRIRIFHGSNLLQDIDNYNLLAKMLFSMQIPDDALTAKYNILCGTKSTASITSGDGATLAASATKTYNYCLNLISLLGTLNANQYFPLFACQSAPLRLEITLVSSPLNAYCDIIGDSTFSLTDVEYVANIIKLSDEAMSLVYSSLNGQPLQIAVPDWSNYSTNISLTASTATQISFPINAKYSSLKSIIIGCRQKPNAKTFFPLSCTAQGISSYFFRIGADVVPSKAPDNLVMMYSEAVKAMGSMSDVLYTSGMNFTNYSLDKDTAMDVNTISTLSSGCAIFGLDLENFSNSTKSGIFAGLNSNTMDIYWVPTFKTTITESYRLDAYALFDSVLVFENNTCYRKF